MSCREDLKTYTKGALQLLYNIKYRVGKPPNKWEMKKLYLKMKYETCKSCIEKIDHDKL